MRKTIYILSALREILGAANRRYLEFLDALDDPTVGLKHLLKISKRVRDPRQRSYRGFNLFDGDESELGADEVKFDNTEEKGKEILVTKESTIQAAPAEKWMRSVDTETRDILRFRFALEAAREEAP